MTVQDAPEAAAGQAAPSVEGRPHGSGAELIRAALAPVICAAALIGLLSAWVATGGAGTVSRVTIKVGLAAVTLPSSSEPDAADTYLTITNLGGPDRLLSVRSPEAEHVVLVRHTGSAAGPGTALRQVAIPAHGTLSLNPFGVDIVLRDPRSLTVDDSVVLVLTFQHGGRVTVYATVTPPGTP
ncbi:MAG TPA: copper chaperone PCu(A)C [Streptosporangiaceae bacterium]|nr:copper chaperone PCu(A)C [Streptosporangiaceae bacterium]